MPRYDQINWDKAACAGMPTNLFYVFEENSKVRDWVDISVVRKVCFACPLWRQCLSYALVAEDTGIWGGLLTAERRALVAGEPSPVFGRVIQELFDAGIAIAEIQEVLDEYPRDERSMANEFAD